jgi:hypothetical protein
MKLHLDFFGHLIKIIPRNGALVKGEVDFSHIDIEDFKVWTNFLVRPSPAQSYTLDISLDG